MQYLSFNIGGTPIAAPSTVPTGGLTTAAKIIRNGITLAIIIAIILTLFMLIFSGIQWITSGGDKTALDAARKRLIFSIVGLILIFLSFFIINVISFLFGGVPLLELPSS